MYRRNLRVLVIPYWISVGSPLVTHKNGNHSHAKHWTPFVCLLIYSHLEFRCWYIKIMRHWLRGLSPGVKKKKVKWSRYRPGVAQRVGKIIALLFHDRSTRRGWVVSSTPQPHFTPVKDLVRILQVACCAPGLAWMGRKSRRHQDSIPDRPARSQSLYRLSYPAHPSCPKGSRKLRFPDYMTVAHDGGKVIKEIMFC